MKIFTHWVYDPTEQKHTKQFFASKDEQISSEKKERQLFCDVISIREWTVEPDAESVVAFIREQIQIREYDQYEEPEKQTAEDVLGELF